MTYPTLTPGQAAALEAFAEAHRQPWRETLVDGWLTCTEPEALKPALRQVRNSFGPTWLHDVYAWRWTPDLAAWRRPDDDGEAPKWSAPFDPPALGARVRVRINNLGPATVTGYFVQDGYLGVITKLDAAPDWYVKQNGGNVPGHSFGAEIDLLAAETPA